MMKMINCKKGQVPVASRSRLTLIAFLLFGLLSACAGTGSQSVQETIENRAQSRWDALLGGDYASAYSYYSPGYRSSVSVVDFEIGIRTRRVQWVSAEYVDHSCDQSVCTVQFKLGYKVVQPVVGIPVWESFDTIEEKWVKTEDQWWYLPKKQKNQASGDYDHNRPAGTAYIYLLLYCGYGCFTLPHNVILGREWLVRGHDDLWSRVNHFVPA